MALGFHDSSRNFALVAHKLFPCVFVLNWTDLVWCSIFFSSFSYCKQYSFPQILSSLLSLLLSIIHCWYAFTVDTPFFIRFSWSKTGGMFWNCVFWIFIFSIDLCVKIDRIPMVQKLLARKHLIGFDPYFSNSSVCSLKNVRKRRSRTGFYCSMSWIVLIICIS